MAVAVDLDLTPSLEEVRELSRDHNLVPLRHTFIADCETPVSAYLKLRGDGPSFLLESAEQGQQVGRWSFLGFDGTRECARQRRLADPRVVLDQDVALREQGHQDVADDGLRGLDRACDVVPEPRA